TALEGEVGTAPPVAGDDPPFAVVHGLYWLAVNASRAEPVLVAIDDLQWADQASLRLSSIWPTAWQACRSRWRWRGAPETPWRPESRIAWRALSRSPRVTWCPLVR